MLHALGLVGGRYRLERELGRGMSGTVYAARGPAGEVVAVKLLSLFDAGASAERFRRETEILLRMPPHPNVVRVLATAQVIWFGLLGVVQFFGDFLDGWLQITATSSPSPLHSPGSDSPAASGTVWTAGPYPAAVAAGQTVTTRCPSRSKPRT